QALIGLLFFFFRLLLGGFRLALTLRRRCGFLGLAQDARIFFLLATARFFFGGASGRVGLGAAPCLGVLRFALAARTFVGFALQPFLFGPACVFGGPRGRGWCGRGGRARDCGRCRTR